MRKISAPPARGSILQPATHLTDDRRSQMRVYHVAIFVMALATLTAFSKAQVVPGPPYSGCRKGNLSEESPATIKAMTFFLESLKVAIKKGDKRQVATLISYPLSVATFTAEFSVQSEEELKKHYDEVFPKDLRTLLLRQQSECVNRVGVKGFTIGTGEIWFDLFPDGKVRIFSINPVEKTAGGAPMTR